MKRNDPFYRSGPAGEFAINCQHCRRAHYSRRGESWDAFATRFYHDHLIPKHGWTLHEPGSLYVITGTRNSNGNAITRILGFPGPQSVARGA